MLVFKKKKKGGGGGGGEEKKKYLSLLVLVGICPTEAGLCSTADEAPKT